jgi:exopolysaccharide biosynthesis polyprenyl glycosylphosphotransferase
MNGITGRVLAREPDPFMLVAMGSIIPIAGRLSIPDPVATEAPRDAVVDPEDLLDLVDDRTRQLLSRRPRARRGRLVPRALALADLLGLSLAFVCATALWGDRGLLGSPRELKLFVLSLPCWIVVAKLHGLYHRDQERADHCTTDDIVGVFHLVTIGAWLLLVASRIEGWNSPSVLDLAAFWLLAICIVPLARALAREASRRSAAYKQNTVIVGAGDIGQLICRKLIKHPEYGANVVGFVDRTPKIRRADLPDHISILGGPERLPEIVERLQVERVVIAFSNGTVAEQLAILRQLRPLGVQVDLVPWLFELVGPRASVHAIEGLPLVGLPPHRRSSTSRVLKRTIDVLGSAIGLLLLAPLMAYIALRVRLDSPGPILFRQTRLGAGMKEFTVLKFRTMHTDTDNSQHREYIRRSMSFEATPEESGLYKLDRSDVLTGTGRWLRKTSLDELPQLLNVLRGDMSLVGPRPCIPYEAENFQPHHLERFGMPQGLTGLWQVTARAQSTYVEALDLDVAYVRDWSLGLDLRLLLRTPFQLLRQVRATA